MLGKGCLGHPTPGYSRWFILQGDSFDQFTSTSHLGSPSVCTSEFMLGVVLSGSSRVSCFILLISGGVQVAIYPNYPTN